MKANESPHHATQTHQNRPSGSRGTNTGSARSAATMDSSPDSAIVMPSSPMGPGSWCVSSTGRFGVVEPDLAFNRRRRPDTGQCWAPRWLAVEQHGESRIQAWEQHYRRDYPSDGQIRLGTTTSVRTLAHELGHHLVHVLEPARTPAHGKVWVGRFDDAMELIAECLDAPIHWLIAVRCWHPQDHDLSPYSDE